MNTKIFQRLKRDYASLGLGDDFLQAQADALAATNLVTDENLESVVAAQKAFLEGVQKNNDKRVTDAVRKANDTANKKAEEAENTAKAAQSELQKQIEQLQQQLATPTPKSNKDDTKSEDDDFEKRFAKANAETLAQMKELQEAMKSMQELSTKQAEEVKKLTDEKLALEQKQAAQQRQSDIIAKAKELNIPQWRIDEGFTIAQDATDADISDYLTRVSSNITNNTLPSNLHFSIVGKDVTKAEADDLAEKIVG